MSPALDRWADGAPVEEPDEWEERYGPQPMLRAGDCSLAQQLVTLTRWLQVLDDPVLELTPWLRIYCSALLTAALAAAYLLGQAGPVPPDPGGRSD